MEAKFSENWFKQNLSEEEYQVLRKKKTELPFKGKYTHCEEEGVYLCKGCKNKLFSSKDKYDSGSGWPSFTQPAEKCSVVYHEDCNRVEVVCSYCGSHLGHVFDDGPMPTEKRYCINSIALDFKKEN